MIIWCSEARNEFEEAHTSPTYVAGEIGSAHGGASDQDRRTLSLNNILKSKNHTQLSAAGPAYLARPTCLTSGGAAEARRLRGFVCLMFGRSQKATNKSVDAVHNPKPQGLQKRKHLSIYRNHTYIAGLNSGTFGGPVKRPLFNTGIISTNKDVHSRVALIYPAGHRSAACGVLLVYFLKKERWGLCWF
jgi:hypothetical protein